LGGSCVHVADHNFKAGEESRVILKQYSINPTVLNSRQTAEAFQTCPAATAYIPYLLWRTLSCNLRWREAEASVDGSTLPSQGALIVFQGLRLNPRQITHHVQYINAGTARCLAIRDTSVRMEWEARGSLWTYPTTSISSWNRNKIQKLARLGGSRTMIRELQGVRCRETDLRPNLDYSPSSWMLSVAARTNQPWSIVKSEGV
jgi:hypothetical protein